MNQSPITITCLGHGGAFADQSVGNTAYLVDFEDLRILVDCGGTVPEVLKEFDIDPGSLSVIMLTHLHGDHAAGLERLLYHRQFISKVPAVILCAGRHVIREWRTYNSNIGNGLNDLVDFESVPTGESEVIIGNFSAQAFETSHDTNPNGMLADMRCYSYLLTLGNLKVFFSGDRVWQHAGDDKLHDAMLAADFVFHELELFSPASGVHTNIEDFDTVPPSQFRWGHHGAKATDPAPDYFKLAYKGQRWLTDERGFRLVTRA